MHRLGSRPSLLKAAAVGLTVVIAILGFTNYLGGGYVGASASGPSPSHTGAPGEANCTSCHSDFPVNSGTGSVTISGIPANYLPGQQVPITVTTSQADGAVVFGFQLTAVDSTGRAAGVFTVPGGIPPRTQIVAGLVGPNERKYVEHTVDGIVGGFTSNTWTFTWTAPNRRIGKVSFHAAGNAANSDGSTTGDYIYTNARASLSGSAISNFDIDSKTDFAIWRPSSATWFTLNSTNLEFQAVQWGSSTDRIVPGDYDGDGKTDMAVWTPSTGLWTIRKSTGGSISGAWGVSTDVPVPGDYDGDLKTDIAVWRPSTGQWFILKSSNGAADIRSWGALGDKPVPGDYDADGKTDSAVFRPGDGNWYIFTSSNNNFLVAPWGIATDKPVPADYDGDGKHDIAVYRPSAGSWFIFRSSDNTAIVAGWGAGADIPVPADYDGDGSADMAVYRDGIWYVLQSSDNQFQAIPWGSANDVPVPAGYIPQ